MNERIRVLEEKVAYLERHVADQDKVMLEFSRTLDAIRRELKTLRERPTRGGEPADERAADERPPHY